MEACRGLPWPRLGRLSIEKNSSGAQRVQNETRVPSASFLPSLQTQAGRLLIEAWSTWRGRGFPVRGTRDAGAAQGWHLKLIQQDGAEPGIPFLHQALG